jgi:hypothetical protein
MTRPASGDPDGLTLAAEVLGDLAAHEVPLGPMTTYRVGG